MHAPWLELRPHPGDSPPQGLRVRAAAVRAHWRHSPAILMHYAVEGPLVSLRWPAPTHPRRADGLWKHTCFEAFLADSSGTGYTEINLSPSGEWAQYRFSAERVPVISEQPADSAVWLEMEHQHTPHLYSLWAAMPEAALEIVAPAAGVPAGLSAVLETSSGELSYWALHHPSERPDFHHRASRTQRLAPPLSSSSA